ncbi:MAG: hypothetical protein KKF56_00115 [Nanoarchaeota archaeon]|nr:hypothetical protein [Nanoarchaeota archaeon]
MPLFDYHCNGEGCEYEGEHLVDTPGERVNCPDCGNQLEKHAIAVINIGGGGNGEGNDSDGVGNVGEENGQKHDEKIVAEGIVIHGDLQRVISVRPARITCDGENHRIYEQPSDATRKWRQVKRGPSSN